MKIKFKFIDTQKCFPVKRHREMKKKFFLFWFNDNLSKHLQHSHSHIVKGKKKVTGGQNTGWKQFWKINKHRNVKWDIYEANSEEVENVFFFFFISIRRVHLNRLSSTIHPIYLFPFFVFYVSRVYWIKKYCLWMEVTMSC